MKYYKLYMGRQHISPQRHRRLLALADNLSARREKAPVSRLWQKYAALAACCALALGLGVWKWTAAGQAANDAQPGVQDAYGPGETPPGGGLSVEGPDGAAQMLPYIPYIHYQDITQAPAADYSYALSEGSYDMELTGEQIRGIFGAEALPWMLFWGDYALWGRALYDGGGSLLWLAVYGEHPEGPSFTLELRPGALPLACTVNLGLTLETSDVGGVPVVGWREVYDWNGDGVTDYICASEFMAGDVGVRFESAGSPFDRQSGGGDAGPAALAQQFNALFVRQALAEDGGLHLEHLLVNEHIPAWRSQEFSSLAQARQEGAFAPYLPTADIPGYGDFYGRLSYQAGDHNDLFVRWSRGYDSVEVDVRLPEGDEAYEPVDASNPAAYDVRLYEIPWGESVPEEYRDNFYLPIFRAEDMSLSIVEARGTQKDTGGTAYRFGVLHNGGVLVEYHCDRLTAAQVWALVEETLG